MIWVPASYAVDEELTDKEIMEASLEEEQVFETNTAYINDIEILGANIIKTRIYLKKCHCRRVICMTKT